MKRFPGKSATDETGCSVRPLGAVVAWVCAALLTLGLAAGCGDDEGDGQTDDGDAGVDGGGRDTGSGGDGAVDQGPDLPARGESLTITYTTCEPRPCSSSADVEVKLWVTDEDCRPGSCDATEVTGADFTCEVSCVLTPNLDYAIWEDPTTAGDLRIAAIDASYQVQAPSRVLAQGVVDWMIGPDRLVFSRNRTAFTVPYDGGAEVQLRPLWDERRADVTGGFYYASAVARVLFNLPTSLSAMDLREMPVTDPSNQTLLYHFIADVEQRTGSFYQNQMRMSVSPDGKYVAIVTAALDSRQSCNPDGPNTCDEEYGCSSNSNRCVGEELVLHVINRDAADQLSNPGASRRCANSGECGENHLCDLTAPDESGLGECIPGKLVIGPYGRFACETVPNGGPYLDAGEYEAILGPPMWRSDGNIVVLARNECPDLDIAITDLVTFSPALEGKTTIVSNPMSDHGGPDCYDEVEDEYYPEDCIIEISDARMSPSGNTIVFVGSSPRSERDTEAWIIDAFGRGGKELLTDDFLTEVVDVRVYNPR